MIITSAQACIRQPDRDSVGRVAKPPAATFPHDPRESLVRRLQQSRPCRFRTTLNATDSSQQEQTPSRQDLEVELQDAIRLEQYKKAAELRDALKSLHPQDTAFSLKKKLDVFVAEERFEVTAATGLLCLNVCGACFLPHMQLAMTAGQGFASQIH